MQRITIEEALKQNQKWCFQPKGCSMRPLLIQGESSVVIEPLSRPVQKGDVILFHKGELNVLHRVIRFEGEHIITRGDNNVFTERVHPSEILGIMTGYFRLRTSEYTTVDAKQYRLYCSTMPFRYIYLRCRCILSKVKHKLIKQH